jgi:hypothetical protein
MGKMGDDLKKKMGLKQERTEAGEAEEAAAATAEDLKR